MRRLLKGGRVIDPSQQLDAVMDVLIEEDTIVAIEPDISEEGIDEVVSLPGEAWVAPGLVDIHVHLRDPGRLDKETIQSGTEAAIAGGFTAVACMPNTDPVMDNLSTLSYVNTTARDTARITVYPIAAATKNIAGKELTEMGELKAHGAVAFTDDGHCVMDTQVMRHVAEYAKMLGVTYVCHAEDTDLSAEGCMHEGYYSTLLGLQGVPSVSESVIVARDIELSRLTGAHIHFAHISARETVELIRKAKEEGLPVTAEVTPHHLALTDEAIQAYDGDFKMNPPLRSEEDRQALIEGLQNGTIDTIATDHAPHTPDEKSQAFSDCPNGVLGLETALGVVLKHLYHPGHLDASSVINLMSTAPVKTLNLPAGGTLKPGSPADVVVINPTHNWVVDPNQSKSKSRNTCFKGHTLTGKPAMVIARGQVVLDEPALLDVGVPSSTETTPLTTA